MDLIASFSSQQVRSFHFFKITGLIGNQIMNFLFDTGAACSVIGVNQLIKPGAREDKAQMVKQLQNAFIEEAHRQGVSERDERLRAANNEPIVTFPCVCHNILIEGAQVADFFFDFALGEINLPLLGGGFINDCHYSHSINGCVVVTGMTDRPGVEMYRGIHVLDFHKALKAIA